MDFKRWWNFMKMKEQFYIGGCWNRHKKKSGSKAQRKLFEWIGCYSLKFFPWSLNIEVITKEWLKYEREPVVCGSTVWASELWLIRLFWPLVGWILNHKTWKRNSVATSLSFNGIYVLTKKLEVTKTEVFLQFNLWICSNTKDPQVQNSSIIYSFKINF